MPPVMNFDPTKAQATIKPFPKGEHYEIQIGEPKAFHTIPKEGKQGNEQKGIMYPIVITEGPNKGMRQFVRFDYLNEWGQTFGKQFIMAALGYPITDEGEMRFNMDQADKDFSLDPDTGAVGDAYRSITGKRIFLDADVNPAQDGSGRMFNAFSNYQPLS